MQPQVVRQLLALLLALAGLTVAPAAAAAKPRPTFLDTARASGDNVVLDQYSVRDIEVDAFSGPSGENPGGHVSFRTTFFPEPLTGPVTCLSVAGNAAAMTVAGPFPSFPGTLGITVKLVDNGASGLDRFQYFPVLPEVPEYLDCRRSPLPADLGGPLIGRAQVFDSPPPPRWKRECRHGGWARFGFRSKRKCIRYVKRSRRVG